MIQVSSNLSNNDDSFSCTDLHYSNNDIPVANLAATSAQITLDNVARGHSNIPPSASAFIKLYGPTAMVKTWKKIPIQLP